MAASPSVEAKAMSTKVNSERIPNDRTSGAESLKIEGPGWEGAAGRTGPAGCDVIEAVHSSRASGRGGERRAGIRGIRMVQGDRRMGPSWVRQFADWRPFASLRARPPGEKRFLLLVPLTGVATGFASVALIRLLGLVQQVFWGSRHELLQHALLLPAWQRFAIPTVGGVLVGLIILVARQPVGGHGTAGIIEAVAQRGGFLPFRRRLIKAAATIVTVGSGGAPRREGSLVPVGGPPGSLLRRPLPPGGHPATHPRRGGRAPRSPGARHPPRAG